MEIAAQLEELETVLLLESAKAILVVNDTQSQDIPDVSDDINIIFITTECFGTGTCAQEYGLRHVFLPRGAKLVCALPFQYKLFYLTLFHRGDFSQNLFIHDLLTEGQIAHISYRIMINGRTNLKAKPLLLPALTSGWALRPRESSFSTKSVVWSSRYGVLKMARQQRPSSRKSIRNAKLKFGNLTKTQSKAWLPFSSALKALID